MINLIPKLRGVFFVYIRPYLVFISIILRFNLLVHLSPWLQKSLFNQLSAPRTAHAECQCEGGSQSQIEMKPLSPWKAHRCLGRLSPRFLKRKLLLSTMVIQMS